MASCVAVGTVIPVTLTKNSTFFSPLTNFRATTKKRLLPRSVNPSNLLMTADPLQNSKNNLPDGTLDIHTSTHNTTQHNKQPVVNQQL